MRRVCGIVAATIRTYQRWIRLGFPAACRFYPSCSEYAIGALERHGFIHGLRLAIWRVFRCHPYHPGGFDPVP